MVVSSKGKKILVVDDDAGIRSLLRDLLVSEDYIVAEAVNGLEALSLMRVDTPALVLMDLMMPVFSGAEAISVMKTDEDLAHIPVFAMSAGRNIAVMVRDVPADGFVSKPFDIDELLNLVANHAR